MLCVLHTHTHTRPAEGQYEALALNAGEAIRGLTMKLKNNGWFSSKSCIVFG
jgi:hypothetical protein